MAGRQCTICQHECASEITKALIAGGSRREVAVRFGVNDASVQRHRMTCLRLQRQAKLDATTGAEGSQAGVRESVRFDLEKPQAQISATVWLVNEAIALLEKSKKADDRKVALAAMREAWTGLQLLLRSSGQLAGDGMMVNIDARQQAAVTSLPPEAWRALLKMAEAGDSPTITIDVDELTPGDATDNRKLPVLSETEVVRATG